MGNPKKKRLAYLTADEIRGSDHSKVSETLEEFEGDAVSAAGEKIIEELSARLRVKKSEFSVLDCGAASGFFAKELHKNGFKSIYGADIGDYRSKEAGIGGVFADFAVCDFSFDELPWSEKSFHAVTAWCVLPHLENPHKFVREVSRVLKPGGFFILSMPHIASLRARKIFAKTANFERFNDKNNHIAVMPSLVFKNTVLRYFDLIKTDYYIHPNIYKGRFGTVKRMVAEKEIGGKRLREKFKAWFGTNIIYILTKPVD